MNLKNEYLKHKNEIKNRLEEFSKLPEEQRIHELIFCILTPQSNAEKCWLAVQELKKCELKEKNILKCLRPRTRFYKNKTKYLIELKNNWHKLQKLINSKQSPVELRELLTDNKSKYRIKGLGMKEASHFLRNIGKSNNQLAILDRHVLRQLVKLRVIAKEKNLIKKNYLEIESKMKKFSEKAKIPLDELDLLFWKIESGRIFK